MLRRSSLVGVIGVLIFAAGFGTARLVMPAQAAAVALAPQVIDLGALTADDLPPANTYGTRSKILVAQDGATVQVQMGPTPRHFHANANEVQYVIAGSGTEWLADKQVALKPGTLLIIPEGVTHGGLTDPSGTLKLLSVKTPPQASDDYHLVP